METNLLNKNPRVVVFTPNFRSMCFFFIMPSANRAVARVVQLRRFRVKIMGRSTFVAQYVRMVYNFKVSVDS